jgi:hypothetical protein
MSIALTLSPRIGKWTRRPPSLFALALIDSSISGYPGIAVDVSDQTKPKREEHQESEQREYVGKAGHLIFFDTLG